MIVEKKQTTSRYKQLVEILGNEYVQSNVESPFDFIQLAEEGINANIITNFRSYFDVTLENTAHFLDTSEPTLYRWLGQNKNLERNFSVKLFEVTDLFLYGCDIFGGNENFFKWIELPNSVLGGMKPSDLIGIPGGISKVRDVLGRIEFGVYS